jgi:hypothetical protein
VQPPETGPVGLRVTKLLDQTATAAIRREGLFHSGGSVGDVTVCRVAAKPTQGAP